MQDDRRRDRVPCSTTCPARARSDTPDENLVTRARGSDPVPQPRHEPDARRSDVSGRRARATATAAATSARIPLVAPGFQIAFRQTAGFFAADARHSRRASRSRCVRGPQRASGSSTRATSCRPRCRHPRRAARCIASSRSAIGIVNLIAVAARMISSWRIVAHRRAVADARGMSREAELYKDKIEVSLDGRQIFYLFFGGAVIVGLVFVLGVMVGRRVEARGHVDRANVAATVDPLAALDRLEGGSGLSFQGSLRGGEAPHERRREADRGDEASSDEPRRQEARQPKVEEPKQEAKPTKPKVERRPKQGRTKAEAKVEKKDEPKVEKKPEGRRRTKAEQDRDEEDRGEGRSQDEDRRPRRPTTDDKVEAKKTETRRGRRPKDEKKPKFTLQLSSFQDKNEAQAYLDSIKSAGLLGVRHRGRRRRQAVLPRPHGLVQVDGSGERSEGRVREVDEEDRDRYEAVAARQASGSVGDPRRLRAVEHEHEARIARPRPRLFARGCDRVPRSRRASALRASRCRSGLRRPRSGRAAARARHLDLRIGAAIARHAKRTGARCRRRAADEPHSRGARRRADRSPRARSRPCRASAASIASAPSSPWPSASVQSPSALRELRD